MTMRFPRTYADADGGSHFAEVEETFAPIAFVPTNPPLGLSAQRGNPRHQATTWPFLPMASSTIWLRMRRSVSSASPQRKRGSLRRGTTRLAGVAGPRRPSQCLLAGIIDRHLTPLPPRSIIPDDRFI
jgi:hypothetical protein